MNVNQTLGSLALDLRRVAQGYYRGSEAMAARFAEEAKARKEELKNISLKPYLRNLLLKMDEVLMQDDHKKLAEDALMYSILFQNAAKEKS
ncbi:MAG: hypothetical protein HYW62_03400 [Candidatus Levybacteria bacterium]|nr:hypothetical protein [Candidatus Levybacteria bacterium]